MKIFLDIMVRTMGKRLRIFKKGNDKVLHAYRIYSLLFFSLCSIYTLLSLLHSFIFCF